LPVFPHHGRRQAELRLCRALEALAAEGRELAGSEVFTEYGEIDRHAKAARYFAMVYAAKREMFDHLSDIDEKFVV
jgi:hypothetical protein